MSDTGSKMNRDDGSRASANEKGAAGRVKEKLSAKRVRLTLGSFGPEILKTMKQKAS